nr:histone deacetylase 14 [Tanacetum cinerariifolium]
MSRHTSGKKRATLIVIPSIRFTKLIIHHLQRKHRFHPRPDSPLHLSNEEPVLGYLKFSAKGTKSEVFGMPILDSLITAEIQQATYYWEYLANVIHHRKYLAGETGGVQNLPAPKPTQPARKPKAPTRPSISIPVRTAQPAPTSAPAKPQEKKRKQTTETSNKPPKEKKSKHGWISKKRSQKNEEASKTEEVPTVEPQVADEDVDYQKALEESMKDAYALPKGPLPPVVIREPESGKYQPLLEVPGKGKAKVTKKQVAHDLLSLQKHKKTSPADQYIFQRRVSEPTGSSRHDESLYALLGQSDNEEESEKVVLGTVEGGQDEGQAGPDSDAGSNPDETSKGQVGPDPGDAEAKVQSISSHVVHAGLDRKHMDLDVADVSPQPSTEQLDEGPESPKEHQQLKATTTDTTTTTTLPPPQALQQSMTVVMMVKRIGELEHIMADLIQVNKDMEKRLDSHESRLHILEQLDIPQRVSIAESDSYKSHEDHMQLFEALKKSMNRDHSKELAQDLAEARKKKKKSRESLKTPPGSPSHQPPPPPPPACPSGALGAPRASVSAQLLPSPPPPSSTNQESLSKGSATPNLEMDEDMAPDEQAQSSDDEDIGSAHIPTVNLRQGWWKPFEEERPTTSEPAWSIRSSDVPVLTNIWASALARGITELKPQDLEGPAYEIVNVFHPDVIHLQYQMKECHKLLTDSVDDPILRHNVSKPLPLGGPPGQVTIQSDFFLNKDLEISEIR